MDEARNDVVLSDTPQDITHEMTSTQEPRRSGRIIRPHVRFIGLGDVDIVFCPPSICMSDPEKFKNIIFSIFERHFSFWSHCLGHVCVFSSFLGFWSTAQLPFL